MLAVYSCYRSHIWQHIKFLIFRSEEGGDMWEYMLIIKLSLCMKMHIVKKQNFVISLLRLKMDLGFLQLLLWTSHFWRSENVITYHPLYFLYLNFLYNYRYLIWSTSKTFQKPTNQYTVNSFKNSHYGPIS